ncbi:MAG: DUF1016 family protein [Kiritimatiellae bacterium]|nr:DUF1016 family protein [Kiritimatiellia bacterium]
MQKRVTRESLKVKKATGAVVDGAFYGKVRDVFAQARQFVRTTANFAMVKAYWLVGKMIVEKQGGAAKAGYGDKLISTLSERLTEDFGKGFTISNLKYMRQFYLAFPIGHTLCDQLSWSHYRLLISVENEEARQYYLEEARKSLWSVRELQRQINSFYYERLLENRAKGRGTKSAVVPLRPIDKMAPQNVIRDPLVLEFLGLDESEKFLEKDLESLLISHFQKFMMEIGRGFALVARQKRLTLDGKSYHVDLVFYNYILRCFVLCDLKTDELTHADLGQMQMYVNYYERELMNPGDNPPIGIVLCTDKGADLVRYTLPLHNKRIFAAKYKLHLPSEQELIAELRRERAAIEDARCTAKLDTSAIRDIKKSAFARGVKKRG